MVRIDQTMKKSSFQNSAKGGGKGKKKNFSREPSLTSIETDLTSSPDHGSDKAAPLRQHNTRSASKRRSLFGIFQKSNSKRADQDAISAFCSPGRPSTLKEVEESVGGGSASALNSKKMASARSLRSSQRDFSAGDDHNRPIQGRKPSSSRKIRHGSPRRSRAPKTHQPVWSPPTGLDSDVLSSPPGENRKHLSNVIHEPKSDTALACAVDQLLGGPAGTSSVAREEISISFAPPDKQEADVSDHAFVENEVPPKHEETMESTPPDDPLEDRPQASGVTEVMVTLEVPESSTGASPEDEVMKLGPGRHFDPPTPIFERKHRKNTRRNGSSKDMNLNNMKGDDFREMVVNQMAKPVVPKKEKQRAPVPRVISCAGNNSTPKQRRRVKQQAQKAQRLLSEFDGSDEQWEEDLARLEAEVQKLRREVSCTRLTQFQHLDHSDSFSSLEDDEDSYYREQKAMKSGDMVEGDDAVEDDDNEDNT